MRVTEHLHAVQMRITDRLRGAQMQVSEQMRSAHIQVIERLHGTHIQVTPACMAHRHASQSACSARRCESESAYMAHTCKSQSARKAHRCESQSACMAFKCESQSACVARGTRSTESPWPPWAFVVKAVFWTSDLYHGLRDRLRKPRVTPDIEKADGGHMSLKLGDSIIETNTGKVLMEEGRVELLPLWAGCLVPSFISALPCVCILIEVPRMWSWHCRILWHNLC